MNTQNEVEIPLGRIEEAFLGAACPGFFGSITADVRVMAAAALEVEVTIRRRQIEQAAVTSDTGPIIPSGHRLAIVRNKLRDFQNRFKLSTPVLSVKGNFNDGELKTFEVVTAPEL